MSAEEPQPSGDIIAALGEMCEERGATVAVSPACYQWFADADDAAMRELIRVAARATRAAFRRLSRSARLSLPWKRWPQCRCRRLKRHGRRLADDCYLMPGLLHIARLVPGGCDDLSARRGVERDFPIHDAGTRGHDLGGLTVDGDGGNRAVVVRDAGDEHFAAKHPRVASRSG